MRSEAIFKCLPRVKLLPRFAMVDNVVNALQCSKSFLHSFKTTDRSIVHKRSYVSFVDNLFSLSAAGYINIIMHHTTVRLVINNAILRCFSTCVLYDVNNNNDNANYLWKFSKNERCGRHEYFSSWSFSDGGICARVYSRTVLDG
jgi:hypothetical protein